MAAWDFSYGGHLAGSTLRPKRVAPLLSGGRAWGAAVAAYHSNLDADQPGQLALDALDASLEADAERQREFGVHDQDAHDELRMQLMAMLVHYVETAEPLAIEALEHEILVSIPSRTGQRVSSKYRLLAYLDGTREIDGRTWLVEFKLRRRLMPVEQIALSRQLRWYAWAFWASTGIEPAGVEVVERLNEAPKPPRILKSGKLSHAKDQLCTLDAYLAACDEHDETPSEDAVAEIGQRRWQQRVPIVFRPGELVEAGLELVSAAKLIHMLDTGQLMPLRNPKRATCGGCFFTEICPSPDNELVDALYERGAPKRDQQREGAAT